MTKAAVVSFKSFLLFTILLTIMRLGETVPRKKNLKEGTSHVGEYVDVRRWLIYVLYGLMPSVQIVGSNPAYPRQLTQIACSVSCW